MFFQSKKIASTTKTFSIGDFNTWKNNFLKASYLTNKLFLLLFKDKITLFPETERRILLKNIQPQDYALIGINP